MHKIYTVFFGLLMMLTCSGCFEIVEQVSLKEDGSGTFKLIVNASQSKDNIKGILAKDSLFGKPLPKQADMLAKMQEAKNTFAGQAGIQNVGLAQDLNNFVFTLTADFSSVEALDKGLAATVQSYAKEGATVPTGNFVLEGKTFTRKVNYNYTGEVSKKMNSQAEDILEKATFTAIYRLPTPVKSMTNGKAKKSPSGKAVMLKTNMLNIANSEKAIANTIVME